MPLEAIIFDVDGTLAETEETHRHAFNQAFAESGRSWRWSRDDYARLLTTTGGRERIARHMSEAGLAPDPDAIAVLHVAKNRIYADRIARGTVTPRPGVVALIGEARRRGIRLAIATTTSRSNLAALLHHSFGADAWGWFAAIVTGEDVAVKKPDPEVYRRALSALSLAGPACIAIEDSRHGLDAARGCRIATVVTPSRYTMTDDFTGAALIRDSLCQNGDQIDVRMLESLLSPPPRGVD